MVIYLKDNYYISYNKSIYYVQQWVILMVICGVNVKYGDYIIVMKHNWCVFFDIVK